MKKRRNSAFTIVEIIVIVVVVALISSLAVSTFSSVRQDSRDTRRQGNVAIISEALEKYYEKNGEYPSVASIVNSQTGNTGAAIAEKLSVPAESLIMPNTPSSTTNSLTADPDTSGDYIAYVGQSASENTRCQTDPNGGCDQYELRYRKESGEEQAIESRRGSRVAVVQPDLTVVAVSATQINASWTNVAGATSYTLQRSLSASMDSPTATSHSSANTAVTGLASNTTYYFRVQASLPDSTSEWSEVQSATTNGVPAPRGTLTITATLSGTNAVGTAGGGSCPAGMVIERQVRYHATATATAGAWSSYTTGTPRSVAASEGWQYTFQQQARCTSGGASSGWVQSGTAAIVRPMTTIPAAPVIGVSSSSTGSTWTWSTPACPTGASSQYRTNRSMDNGQPATGWSSAINSATPPSYFWSDRREGYIYTNEIQVRCYTQHSTGNWSASGSANYLRPVNAPGLATNFRIESDPSPGWWRLTYDHPSCGLGTSLWSYSGATWNRVTNSYPNTVYYSPNYVNNAVRFGLPSGTPVGYRINYLCVNTVTNRQSSVGPLATSPILTLP